MTATHVTTGDSNPNRYNIKRKMTQKHLITIKSEAKCFETVQNNRDDRRKLNSQI